MGASKRFVPNTASWSDCLDYDLVRPIQLAIASAHGANGAIAVGLSGGPDSAMLAVHAAAWASTASVPLHFFHVHHGLQAVADRWEDHIHDLGQLLRIPCHSTRAQVDLSKGDGIESAAREARYQAFRRLATQVGVQCLLLAHHRDDQAETVLLRLLRGAGPAGLAAMCPSSRRDGILYLRPWLGVARATILSAADCFEHRTGWAPVHDPTNAHDKYTRAAVRERLAPALNERWPGWQANLARHARLSAEAQQVLDEVAADDFPLLEPSADGKSFSLKAWRSLSPTRQALLLRYWLSRHGLRMPTEARLADIMRQLRGLHAMGHDRSMRVKHGDAWISCVKGRITISRE